MQKKKKNRNTNPELTNFEVILKQGKSTSANMEHEKKIRSKVNNV